MLSDRHIRRIVKGYAIKAGIRKPEEIHPHTLRHSYATHLQNQGLPLNAIQQILGHENIETTTIYLHLGTERIRDLVEKAFRI
jgi:integrase/recombinase XerD